MLGETSSFWKVFHLGHREVCDNDGDNHGVVLVDGVDTLEVPIRESDRRETLL